MTDKITRIGRNDDDEMEAVDTRSLDDHTQEAYELGWGDGYAEGFGKASAAPQPQQETPDMADAPEGYETVCFKIVWHAELGMCDGGGIGYWSHTSFSEPFPTENAAWDRLKHHPDVIPDQERRRYRHKNGMGLVRVRRDLVPCAVPQPQEPTPEAVERAAKAAWDKAQFLNVWDPAQSVRPWPPRVPVEADEWRETIRAALLAAASPA